MVKKKDKHLTISYGKPAKKSVEANWVKIGVTVILGCLLGVYFKNTSMDVATVMQFITIMLVVLCLVLLLDLRRHADCV